MRQEDRAKAERAMENDLEVLKWQLKEEQEFHR